MKMWINSRGSIPEFTANKRQEANLTSAIISKLDALGELVEIIEKVDMGPYSWWHFKDAQNNLFWMRGDVFYGSTLLDGRYVLDNVPYVSQNEPDTAFTNNDCGSASCVGLLAAENTKTTLRKFMQDADIVHNRVTEYYEIRRGVQAYGMDLKHIRPMHLSSVLNYVIEKKKPVMTLVYRHQLIPGKDYGHFLNVIGYQLQDWDLRIVVHDSDGKPFTEYPALQFAKALGSVGFNGLGGNMPFQGMVIERVQETQNVQV